ncbi:nitrile hydratase accessory protein [Hwanghaeella grinnelliae]|uniref:Nitrile hydratase accessory protein n=1 Tax=Hwanghaeella grinnelliae TaxID=2500179 RepID=A0A437QPT8_9PROT|nr:nitrile hydratase accessory protein [Hwanghaeella grinnelliae]RVU36515.1 nitrile hydratase accessory protein [Hwanghaeella grinnelliae]
MTSDSESHGFTAIPGIDADGPVFREPWEAQAFALTVTLHEAGLFTWDEWAATLSAEIASAQSSGDPDLGNTYYRHWQNALERLVVAKGATLGDELEGRVETWRQAYMNTPHGQPIELSAGHAARRSTGNSG